MSDAIPKNINQLAEKNTAFLARMNFTPGKDDPAELCNPAEYRKTGLFEDNVVDTIFNGGSPEEQGHVKWVASNLAMVLVRPDMLHIAPAIEAFLAERYNLVYTEDVEMDPTKYWNIYKHDLYRIETMHTRLTRAAMYIGSTCRLVVFSTNNYTRVLANDIYSKLKGNQGVYTGGTLRGDLVYREGLRLGLDRLDEKDLDPRVAVATDMFGAYRASALLPTGPHIGLARPLLFYTGVGVHIPNGTEVHGDLAQFLGPDDFLQQAEDMPEVRDH
ncbi:MAG: hypothetical protein U0520_02680 [Candidatus Saccharimonadales bacterium]